jgi:hypothetical protein
MPLNDFERERVRYHLGYPQVQPAASIVFGVPRPIQTEFLVEQSMTFILPMAEDRVRKILTVMDGVECRLEAAQDRLAAMKLDSLELRSDECGQLETEYQRWGFRLADVLGVPVYAYSTKYRGASTGKPSGGSIPVRG